MAEFPALPLFTDAYMADTRHLTAAQHGAYLLLLMTAWRMPDCKLPDDDKFLSRCASMDLRTWRANRDAIMAFWKVDETQKFYQGRLLDERKYVDDMKRKNSEAGKASALKRNNRQSTTVATKAQRDSNPHTHTHTILKDNTSVLSKKATRLAQDWVLPEEWGIWAEQFNLTTEQIVTEGQKFKDYWHSTGKTKVDWQATWRNWIRTALERKK